MKRGSTNGMDKKRFSWKIPEGFLIFRGVGRACSKKPEGAKNVVRGLATYNL